MPVTDPTARRRAGCDSLSPTRSGALFERAGAATGKDVAIDSSVRVLDGDFVEDIRRTLREEEAELLIVGRGHAMESFSCVWSHLYAIIRESSCPVLSV